MAYRRPRIPQYVAYGTFIAVAASVLYLAHVIDIGALAGILLTSTVLNTVAFLVEKFFKVRLWALLARACLWGILLMVGGFVVADIIWEFLDLAIGRSSIAAS